MITINGYIIERPSKVRGKDSYFCHVYKDDVWVMALTGRGDTKEEAIANSAYKIGVETFHAQAIVKGSIPTKD